MKQENKPIKEELQAEKASLLQQWQGNSTSWSMPAGYLDDLSERALKEAQQPVTITRSRINDRRRWLAIAASVSLLLLAGSWWLLANYSQTTVSTTMAWEDITTEDLQLFVDNNLEDFDLVLLAETADQEQWPLGDDEAAAIEEYLEESGDWLEDEDWEEDLF